MIPTYDGSAYLEKTLGSVLSQDPGAEVMQVEVVDDASPSGSPEPLVRRVCGDRVSVVRQTQNVGGVANWNSSIAKSIGEWVHILHQDDVVLPGFYARFKNALEGREDIGAAFCRHTGIDEYDGLIWTSELEAPTPGILNGFIKKIGVSQRIQTPSIVVRRSVYEQLGGYRPEMTFAADWEMWIRIAAHYPIWYEPEILAAYRNHSSSWTSACVRSAETILAERRCIAIVRPLLPAASAENIARKAEELASLRAIDFAYDAFSHFDFATAFKQVSEGLKCSCSLRVISAILFLPFRVAMRGARLLYRMTKKRLAEPKTS